MKTALKRADLLHPELSYAIIGCAFEVYNTIGSGHQEKNYQKALREEFKLKKLSFREQVHYPLNYKGEFIGKNFLDFLVDGKVVVEIKKGNIFSKRHIDQVLNYLKLTNMKLAILINFGSEGVAFKRIINL
jgi:GxxExxY protein